MSIDEQSQPAITSAGFIAAFEASKATLFHGTRESLAEGILSGGFRPIPPAEQVDSIADAYGVPRNRLREYMHKTGRFALLDEDRSTTVSTSGNRYKAGGYASRAPEATGEALRGVYALTHPDCDDEYALSGEADFWVLAQQLGDPPFVVEVCAPFGALRSHGFAAGNTATDLLKTMIGLHATPEDPVRTLADGLASFNEMFGDIPEWRVRVEEVEVVSAEPVPTRVGRLALAHMSGQHVLALDDQIRSGFWGEVGNPGVADLPWWPFEQVWSKLTPQRREQLEELARQQLS